MNCKTKLNTFIAIVLIQNFLYSFPLMGDWSDPQVIYPKNPPYNAISPSIAADENGNYLAGWIDISGSGSMQAASSTSRARYWNSTTPVSNSNVRDPQTFNSQSIGVDAGGNAMAVWTDGASVFTSTLSSGSSTWSSPTTINKQGQIVSSPYIAVAPKGIAIVVWSSLNNSSYNIFANVFDGVRWKGQVNLLGGSNNVEYNLSVNPVVINNQGNAIVAVTDTSNNVQAIKYNFKANTWTTISSVAVNSIQSTAAAIDSSGNATVVWLEQDNTVHAATILYNGNKFIDASVLSSTADLQASGPAVAVDAQGNARAVWADTSGALATAYYSYNGENWIVLPMLDLGGNVPYLISLSGDEVGNVVAAWSIFMNSFLESYVQVSSMAGNSSNWKPPTTISSTSNLNYNPQIILTSIGSALAIWVEETPPNGGAGTINYSTYPRIFRY